MSKASRNNLIRCLIFLLILGIAFLYLNQVFSIAESEESKQNFNQFYSEKENTIDGFYFGSSNGTRYWNSSMAYHETGITVYNIATASQSIVAVKSLMKEVEKTQNPKLFVVELRWLNRGHDRIEETFIRKVTDCMALFSAERIECINESVDFALPGDNDVVDNKLDYYVPIFKYHNRWNGGDLSSDDFKINGPRNQWKGFTLSPGKSFEQNEQEPAVYSDKTEALEPETEQVVDELLDYCDSIDTEVLFVLSPHSLKEQDVGKLNEAVKIVSERGYPILNFNTEDMIEELDINWETDFYNANHANILGAEKYTKYLANYISEHYDLKDRRGDAEYKSWDEAYESYLDYIKEKRPKMKTS